MKYFLTIMFSFLIAMPASAKGPINKDDPRYPIFEELAPRMFNAFQYLGWTECKLDTLESGSVVARCDRDYRASYCFNDAGLSRCEDGLMSGHSSNVKINKKQTKAKITWQIYVFDQKEFEKGSMLQVVTFRFKKNKKTGEWDKSTMTFGPVLDF